MEQYLTTKKPSTSSSGGVSKGDWLTGTVHGGALFCRKQPDKNASYWGRFQDKAVIPIKMRTDDWYETYWNDDASKVGYVSKSYVTPNSSSDSSTPKPSGRIVGLKFRLEKLLNFTLKIWTYRPIICLVAPNSYSFRNCRL